MITMNPDVQLIAQAENFDYYAIKGEVYRRPNYCKVVLDVWGFPSDLRHECSLVHFERFKVVAYGVAA